MRLGCQIHFLSRKKGITAVFFFCSINILLAGKALAPHYDGAQAFNTLTQYKGNKGINGNI